MSEELKQDKKQEEPSGTLKAEERVLFSWKAPARPFKARGRDFFSTILALAALSGVIMFFIEGVMPVFVIGAVVFLIFVLFTVQPEEIQYEITNKHIVIASKRYSIEEFSRFWITERLGHTLLVLEIPFRFPGRLELVVRDIDVGKLKSQLSKYLTLEEAPPTLLDKTASWFSKHLPLES